MSLEKKLVDELRGRRARIRAGGGADKLAARRDKGLMTARERIDALCQPHTFQESGAHAEHGSGHFGTGSKAMPADGVVVGTG